MAESLETIFKGAIIGDAAGYTLNGLKKAHINAVFHELQGFTDTAPALKHGMEKWRKPGLYSSITQFMILAGACTETRFFNAEKFSDAVKNAPELPDHDYSYFRDPGAAEKNFITFAGTLPAGQARFDHPCARIIPVSLPALLMRMNGENLIIPVFRFVSLFTSDIPTALSSAILVHIIDQANPENTVSLFEQAMISSAAVASYVEENQHLLFELGYNPDYVINEAHCINTIIRKVSASGSITSSEQVIITEVNKKLKTPVTRASVNLPFTVFPFAISIAANTANPPDVFLAAAAEGGASSAIASIAGALTCARFGDCIPPGLEEGLINRKKILSMTADIAAGRNRDQVIKELSSQESSLTKKEHEEFLAKNRKSVRKKSPGSEKKQGKPVDLLSKHIVESWTKIDKAKWKKEKNRNNEDPEL
ncbi:MAG TPA: ADP-ribosylglycohydrolase family protein [Spirochaetota bacterium]|nr:ADP-ribosylglycohydrolase family protein [Spirochaetota bacterium]